MSRFVVTYPVWMCFRDSQPDAPAAARLADGRLAVAVFTDEDLAMRFIAARGGEPARPGAFDGRENFEGALRAVMEDGGVLTVAFDVSGEEGASAKFVFQIADLLEQL